MKKFTKHKYNKRLMNLVRFDRHKNVRKSLTSSKKKIIFFSGLKYNKIKRRSVLKTDRLKFYEQQTINGTTTRTPNGNAVDKENAENLLVQSTNDTKKTNRNETKQNKEQLVAIKKKKYKLNSYLFNVICKLPRKYAQNFVGKEVLRKYYTMPLKLSMTRFTINKILRGYYKHLSYKALSNLSRNKSLSKIQKNVISNKQPIYSAKNAKPENGKVGNAPGYNLEKKEVSKNFIESLEERLDSSILRLLNFKSLYTIKRSSYASRYKDNAVGRKKRFPRYTVKSPMTNYTALQVKQLINHGHISINNKKVTSGNYKIQLGHELKVNGFISKLAVINQTDPAVNTTLSLMHDLKNNHKHTLLLRRLKNQDYIQNLAANGLSIANGVNEGNVDINAEESLIGFIKNLRVKRMTEVFYMTYRNMHLLDRSLSGVAAASEPENSQIHIEKHIKPLFDYMGHNQSMFMLWPVVSLLKISSFTKASSSSSAKNAGTNALSLASVKKNIIQFSITSSKEDKQKLQNLLRYKRNLSRLETSYKLSAQAQENSENEEGSAKSIPGKVMQIASVDKSKILYARSSKCYASLLYGTRVCKWIRFQQNVKSSFHNQLYNKLNFFEWELEFYQYIVKYYK